MLNFGGVYGETCCQFPGLLPNFQGVYLNMKWVSKGDDEDDEDDKHEDTLWYTNIAHENPHVSW